MSALSPLDPSALCGLILAGGRGSRMGGLDKGLQPYRGRPLVQHAQQRLAPQVGQLMISANRHLPAYAALGVSVWPDTGSDYPGPLAGFLAGLTHCETPYLVTVPCDSPCFPLDLVARLAAALHAQQADLAMPLTLEADGREQLHPVFCLMRTTLKDSLATFMAGGQRSIERGARLHRLAQVPFDDGEAFFNANTPEDLRA